MKEKNCIFCKTQDKLIAIRSKENRCEDSYECLECVIENSVRSNFLDLPKEVKI